MTDEEMADRQIEFIIRAGFTWGWEHLESWARRMAAHAVDELDAKDYEIKKLRERLEAERKMRPQWAQGYTDDSIAAQMSTFAMQTLWDLLGVDNQTDAVRKLKELTK